MQLKCAHVVLSSAAAGRVLDMSQTITMAAGSTHQKKGEERESSGALVPRVGGGGIAALYKTGFQSWRFILRCTFARRTAPFCGAHSRNRQLDYRDGGID
jgi:hypothetical protein